MNETFLAGSYFLHLLATVVWLGGMALLVVVIYPTQARTASTETHHLLDRIEARFRPIANFSLLVLLMTGVVQTSGDEHYGGLLSIEDTWSRAIFGKHLALVGMLAVVLFLQFGLEPALERARLFSKQQDSTQQVLQLRQRRRRLMQINFGLSIIVLLFTAIATAV